MTSARFALSTFMLALLASPVFAVDAGSGKILFDARWRLESVDDDTFADSASATFGLRLASARARSLRIRSMMGLVVMVGAFLLS